MTDSTPLPTPDDPGQQYRVDVVLGQLNTKGSEHILAQPLDDPFVTVQLSIEESDFQERLVTDPETGKKFLPVMVQVSGTRAANRKVFAPWTEEQLRANIERRCPFGEEVGTHAPHLWDDPKASHQSWCDGEPPTRGEASDGSNVVPLRKEE